MLLHHRDQLDHRVSKWFLAAVAGLAIVIIASVAASPLPGKLAAQVNPPEEASAKPTANSSPDKSEKEKSPPSIPREHLSYAGKSFDEWKNIFQHDLHPQTRIGAIKALTAFGGNGYENEVTSLLCEALQRKDANDVYPDAIGAAASLGKAGFPAVEIAAGKSNYHFRMTAAQVLRPSNFDVEIGLPLLVNLLDDSNDAVRQSACNSIAEYGENAESARAKLLNVSRTDAVINVRSCAYRALGFLGKPDAETREELLRMLNDPNERLACVAATSLVRSQDDSADSHDALVKLIADGGSRGRMLVQNDFRDRLDPSYVGELLVEVSSKLEFPRQDDLAHSMLSLVDLGVITRESAEPVFRNLLRSKNLRLFAAAKLVALPPRQKESFNAIREAAKPPVDGEAELVSIRADWQKLLALLDEIPEPE